MNTDHGMHVAVRYRTIFRPSCFILKSPCVCYCNCPNDARQGDHHTGLANSVGGEGRARQDIGQAWPFTFYFFIVNAIVSYYIVERWV